MYRSALLAASDALGDGLAISIAVRKAKRDGPLKSEEEGWLLKLRSTVMPQIIDPNNCCAAANALEGSKGQ